MHLCVLSYNLVLGCFFCISKCTALVIDVSFWLYPGSFDSLCSLRSITIVLGIRNFFCPSLESAISPMNLVILTGKYSQELRSVCVLLYKDVTPRVSQEQGLGILHVHEPVYNTGL